MGHYLILDRAAAFAVAIQEALEQRGHSADFYQDPLEASAALADFGADVLILDLGLGTLSEHELVGTFRSVPENRSLPIIGLTENTDSSYVIGVLQMGLRDVLSRRSPLDELIVRIIHTTVDQPLMQGRLAGGQLLEFLEYLRHMGKSGVLQVTSRGGVGRIEMRRGAIAGARFKNLRGKAAVLALLDQETGKFRLEAARETGDLDESTGGHDVQNILLRAAWLSDKLEAYRDHIPRSGHELTLASKTSPSELGDGADSLPIEAILDVTEENGFVRFHDLKREIAVAPQELRLALAMLTRKGVLKLSSLEEVPSTQELKSHLGVEFSVLDLLQRARREGVGERSVSLMMIVEEGAWPSLRAIFEPVWETPFGNLARLLDSQDHACVSVDTEDGRLVLHLQRFSVAMVEEAKALLAACDGALLWLDQAVQGELLMEIAERLPTSQGAVRGVVVGTKPASLAWSRETLARRPEWLLCLKPPAQLSSLLRCFYSRSSGGS